MGKYEDDTCKGGYDVTLHSLLQELIDQKCRWNVVVTLLKADAKTDADCTSTECLYIPTYASCTVYNPGADTEFLPGKGAQ